jgi:hypothetical protein
MTSPFALVLSMAGTACIFIIALVGIIADAASAPTPAESEATAHSLVATVAQDVRYGDPVLYTVALEPAASRR